MRRLPLGDLREFSSKEVRQLLHNKSVVILGDSIQKAIYKDLVRFLQNEELLTYEELNKSNQPTFWNDHRVEWDYLHNKTSYREVREYRTDHHLVRFYFITRVYSDYVESILEDFKADPAPDLLILNSCLWDLNRYLDRSSREPLTKAFREYQENLHTLFQKLHNILPTSCLIIWNTTTPVAREVTGAYCEKGVPNKATPEDVLRANFEGAVLACCYQFDVLDLNFCFRFLQDHRRHDGVHWNKWVHRYITNLLLTHVAKAWGVELPKEFPQNGIPWNGNANQQFTCAKSPPFAPLHPSHDLNFQHDSISNSGSFSGFINFEDDSQLPAHLEETQHGGFHGPAGFVFGGGQAAPCRFPVSQGPGGGQAAPCFPPVDQVPSEGWGFPIPSLVDPVPNAWQGRFYPPPHRSHEGYRGRHHNGRIMRHQRFYGEHYRPYALPPRGAGRHPPFQAPPYVGWRGW